MQQVSKNFGGVKALTNLDLDVQAGSVHGLIGPNGSGKTTTFNVISGVLPVSGGRVLFDGAEITSLPPHRISRLGMSRTFQIPRIMPRLSVLENTMSGLFGRTKADVGGTFFHPPSRQGAQERMMREQAMHFLEFVGLAGQHSRWAGELVWAQQHLLQIARALATAPKLLLLDEPTAGMGAEESREMEGIIARIRQSGTTVILIAHDVKLVTRASDTVTAIEFGEKIAEGPPEQVQRDPKVVEAYLGTE